MLFSLKKAAAGVMLAAATAFATVACQQKAASNEPATPAAATPVHVAAYVCPMGCEGSESDKPGKCPVCEMTLEPNPAAKTAQ